MTWEERMPAGLVAVASSLPEAVEIAQGLSGNTGRRYKVSLCRGPGSICQGMPRHFAVRLVG